MAEIDYLTAPAPTSAPDMGSARLADDASMQQFDALQQEQKRQQDRDLAKKSLDQNQIYTLYPDLASADQKAKGTSDAASVMLNLSYRLNKPLDEVRQNFQMLRTGYAQAQGWDVAASDSVFKTKFQEQFQKEDDQQKAIQNLQSKALQDSVSYAGKGMSRNPLAAFSEWDKEHGAIFGDATEAQKLKLFNETYLPVQKQMSSPIGIKAAQLVDALTKNADAVGIPEAGADKTVAAIDQGQDAPAQPEKIDPVQFLKGMSGEEQDKVLGLASQLMATRQPEMGNGMKVAGGLGQAFAQGFLSYNAINQIDDLVDAEKRLKAAQTPEDAQKAKDDIENIKLAQKIKQAEQIGNTVQPELYGLPKFAYEAAQGVASMPGAVAPAVIPVLGEFAFYKLAQAQDAMKLMAQNPGMTAEEAKSKVTIASAAYGITMGRLAAIFGEASPGLKGFLMHNLQATAVMDVAEGERIFGRQLQSFIDPSFNKNEDYGTEWLDLLKSTPMNFVTLAAFGGMVKLMGRGQQADPNSVSELEQQAGNSRLLQYLGFTQETAERVAGLKEGQRLKALADEWGNRTQEQKQAGVELAREDAAKADQTLASPDAPKIEQTPDGKYAVTTKDGDQTHTAVFETEEGARQALQLELQFHEEKNASTDPTNDWVTSTEERPNAITPLESESGKNNISEQEDLTKVANPDISNLDESRTRLVSGDVAKSAVDKLHSVLPSIGKYGIRVSSIHDVQGDPKFALAQGIAGLFGRDVVVFDGAKNAPNGITHPELRDYIFLDKNGDRPFIYTLGHELWHHIEFSSPQLAKSLAKELEKSLNLQGIQDRKARDYTPKQYRGEAYGDLLGNLISDPEQMRRLYERNPSFWGDVGQVLQKWLDKVITTLKGKFSTNEYFRDLELANNRMRDVVTKFSSNPKGESGPISFDKPDDISASHKDSNVLQTDKGLQEKTSDLSDKDKDRFFGAVSEFGSIDKTRGSADFWNAYFKDQKITPQDVDQIESQLTEWKAYYAKKNGGASQAQEEQKAESSNPIQDVLDRYNDGDESIATSADVVNELDGLAGEMDNQELEDAVREYKDARREEREMYGERSGIDDAAFENLVAIAQRIAKEQNNDIRYSKKTPQPIIGDIPPPKTMREQAAEIASRVASTVRDLPKDSAFKRHLLQWSARSQASSDEVMRVQHTIETTIKDKAKRDGITNWIESGGDRALLLQRAAASKDAKVRAGYEAAAKFTPEEIKVAEKVRDTFNILEARAKKWGIDMGHRENYVPHVYLQEPQLPSGSSPKRLSEFFKFSQERTFESYFGGEQAGYHPQTKDISKLLGLYLNDMNNAINSRRFVAELSKGKASDGRPLVSPRGSGTAKKGEHGESEVHLVYPDAAQEGHEDYKVIDQPALHDWSFAGKDENGKNIMVKGDLAVHPEIATKFNNALGSSAIRKWWNEKTDNPFLNFTKGTAKFLLDDLQSLVKGTMLSFSPFHQVQEGIHAIGHRVNPFANIPKIDLRDPKQADAAAHGLMLAHDRLSQSLFMEGVGTNNRNLVTMGLRKIGWGLTTAAADKVDSYQHWLFSQYIPGLKLKTYEHILERNMERFKADIAAGKATEFQVKNLSAHQANAAYGHLNYTEMGHNPTIRHAFQIVLLAPDFLEARSRFVAQSLKSLTGTKTGIEQLQAFAFLAATQVVAATIQKVLTNGDPEWDHPFEMRVGNKYYGMRSVPEDVFKMLHNPTGFIGGRISPIFGRFIQEGVFGVNYRGERTSVGDAIADIMAGIVPMPMQSLTRQWTTGGAANPISPLEQILSSAGVQVHRYSPITKVYPLAHDWVKKNYPEDVQRGSYPVSKYQQLRYALEDNDIEAAKKEVDRLVAGGMNRADLGKAFKLSVNHPFTGSKEHDKEFYKSLDEDDKQRYDAAIERRKEILRRFMSVPY